MNGIVAPGIEPANLGSNLPFGPTGCVCERRVSYVVMGAGFVDLALLLQGARLLPIAPTQGRERAWSY
jgi:hypothetical protein